MVHGSGIVFHGRSCSIPSRQMGGRFFFQALGHIRSLDASLRIVFITCRTGTGIGTRITERVAHVAFTRIHSSFIPRYLATTQLTL